MYKLDNLQMVVKRMHRACIPTMQPEMACTRIEAVNIYHAAC